MFCKWAGQTHGSINGSITAILSGERYAYIDVGFDHRHCLSFIVDWVLSVADSPGYGAGPDPELAC